VSVTDPYKILQVDPEAEDEVIEAAYRRLARKYHPDVASGPDSETRMVAINQAWDQLRDPVRRAAVDRARARDAGAAARVAAAAAHVRTTASPGPSRPRPPEPGRPPAPPRPGSTPSGASSAPPPTWPIPGMRDPSDGEAGPKQAARETVSRDWTSGRSTTGSTYDPSTMRAAQGYGAAGAPPGTPSGSVLNFGRYAGWSLGEIARADIEYLEWLDRMPIGRMYQQEIDGYLRTAGRRRSAPAQQADKRGLFRRR
jgi:DnaJ domain